MTSTVFELRQYTLHPGERDTLIDIFDREFIETQEEVGAHVLGQFRDLDGPDRFVWWRGFADMGARLRALTDFYGGPAWKANRDAANATMADSDDVLLLRPVRPASGLPEGGVRPPVGSAAPDSLVLATIHHLSRPVDEDFRTAFEAAIPALTAAGARPLAYLETEYADNDFSALPVRTGEHVFVWVAAFASPAEAEAHLAAPDLAGLIPPSVRTERLRLAATGRSLLR